MKTLLISLILLSSLSLFSNEVVNWEALGSNNLKFQKLTLTLEAKLISKPKELEKALKIYEKCLIEAKDCYLAKKQYNKIAVEITKSIKNGVISEFKNSIKEIKENIKLEKYKFLGAEGEVKLKNILNDDFELTEDALILAEFEFDIKALEAIIDTESKKLEKISKYTFIANTKDDLSRIRKLITTISDTSNINLKVDREKILAKIKNSTLGNKIRSKYKSFSPKKF